eukprot:TRINITY_DN14464_c0_g2_i1.p1 TRINITY_DN14464_c0_g2~~TRINITY_DN14464_c0_g2_i1.p1  ORF type:complete len:846 (+),score=187.21 TRINITY_DN14464_c0_g2_i1:80-2617(+)
MKHIRHAACRLLFLSLSLQYANAAGSHGALRASSSLTTEVEHTSSHEKTMPHIANLIENPAGKRASLSQLSSMELALTAMVSNGKALTPGVKSFITQVKNITSNHMKPMILRQVDTWRARIADAYKTFKGCHRTLSDELNDAEKVQNTMANLEKDFFRCTQHAATAARNSSNTSATSATLLQTKDSVESDAESVAQANYAYVNGPSGCITGGPNCGDNTPISLLYSSSTKSTATEDDMKKFFKSGMSGAEYALKTGKSQDDVVQAAADAAWTASAGESGVDRLDTVIRASYATSFLVLNKNTANSAIIAAKKAVFYAANRLNITLSNEQLSQRSALAIASAIEKRFFITKETMLWDGSINQGTKLLAGVGVCWAVLAEKGEQIGTAADYCDTVAVAMAATDGGNIPTPQLAFYSYNAAAAVQEIVNPGTEAAAGGAMGEKTALLAGDTAEAAAKYRVLTNRTCPPEGFCPLTKYTCELVDAYQAAFKILDDPTNINSMADPNTGSCNNKSVTGTSVYGDCPEKKGGGCYYAKMLQYWKDQKERWKKAKDGFEIRAMWCMGNQSVCPICPYKGPWTITTTVTTPAPSWSYSTITSYTSAQANSSLAAESDSDSTATLSASEDDAIVLAASSQNLQENSANSSNSTNSTLNLTDRCTSTTCKDCQDMLDKAGCDQGKMQIQACEKYDTCFESANSSLQTAYTDVCVRGSTGDLAALKSEYYAVVRMECILDALEQPEEKRRSAWKNPQHSAIEDCQKKQMSQYDMKMFVFEECTELSGRVWPDNGGVRDPRCIEALNPAHDPNIAGTQKYADKWYARISFPQTCTASCCYTLPNPYVPGVQTAAAAR